MTVLTVHALPGVPEVALGDDLVALLLAALDRADLTLIDGDVVCVAQKIVSKSEGAVVPQPPGDPRVARRAVGRQQAVRVVAENERVMVVQTHHGFVCANAGVDASNLPDGSLALLPTDPDASAEALRRGLAERTGAAVGVIVTDTFGRPWRTGQTDVAIGAAGISVIRDERGGHDREGRVLEVTEAAIADELAGAADLVRRKADGTPFVLIRGANAAGSGSAVDLVRLPDEDLFRWGGPTAIEQALGNVTDATEFGPEVVPEETLAAVLSARDLGDGDATATWTAHDDGASWVLTVPDHEGVPYVADLVRAGAEVQAVRTLAAAHGLLTRWEAVGSSGPAADGAIGTLRIGSAPR